MTHFLDAHIVLGFKNTRITTVILVGCLAGTHVTEKKDNRRGRTHLTASVQKAASFRLHLICEFGQLPEQVQAEYTPLTYSLGPRLKQVFHPE